MKECFFPNEILQLIFLKNEKEWIKLRTLSKYWFRYFTELNFSYYIRLNTNDLMTLEWIKKLCDLLEKKRDDLFLDINEKSIHLVSMFKENNGASGKVYGVVEDYEYPIHFEHHTTNSGKHISFKDAYYSLNISSMLKEWLRTEIPIEIFIAVKKEGREAIWNFYSQEISLLTTQSYSDQSYESVNMIYTLQFEQLCDVDYILRCISISYTWNKRFFHITIYENEQSIFLKWTIRSHKSYGYSATIELWFIQTKENFFTLYRSIPQNIRIKKDKIEFPFKVDSDYFFSHFDKLLSSISFYVNENKINIITLKQTQENGLTERVSIHLDE